MRLKDGDAMAKVIWLTGISGSGKTTLGERLKEELGKKYGHVEFIDGDLVREFFENDLGYTRKERIFNVKRIAFAAMLVAKNGTNVVVANIAPYYEVRDFIRKHIKNYIQIYLEANIGICKERDIKGIYNQVKVGKIKNVVGVDDVYDEPRKPDLIVDTQNENIEQNFEKIIGFLKEKGLI